MREQPFLFGGTWVEVWDGNPTAAALYDRHYSRNPAARGDPRVAGPGEKLVLLTEGAGLASGLIRAAMAIAWARWGLRRLYTYVNPRRVRSTNPGFCFLAAGWRHCGVTKTRRLLILEAQPEWFSGAAA